MSTPRSIELFDQALSNPISDLSLIEAPDLWLIANTEDIRSSLEQLENFSSAGDWKIFVNPGFIYPVSFCTVQANAEVTHVTAFHCVYVCTFKALYK
jgi:hypothetical protein